MWHPSCTGTDIACLCNSLDFVCACAVPCVFVCVVAASERHRKLNYRRLRDRDDADIVLDRSPLIRDKVRANFQESVAEKLLEVERLAPNLKAGDQFEQVEGRT